MLWIIVCNERCFHRHLCSVLVNCELIVLVILLLQYIGFIVVVFCIMAAGVICALVFKTWVCNLYLAAQLLYTSPVSLHNIVLGDHLLSLLVWISVCLYRMCQ